MDEITPDAFNVDKDDIHCVTCDELKEQLKSTESLCNKYKELYANTQNDLLNAQNSTVKLNELILSLQRKERKNESEMKVLEKSMTRQESNNRNSQSSLKLRKSGAFGDKGVMAKELLQKIVKLEDENKSLKRKVKFMTKEVNECDFIYQERLEILYLIALERLK